MSGQQTCPPAHEASAEQVVFVGFRQCLASGQQYSSFLQTGLPVGGAQGSDSLTHSFVICKRAKHGALHMHTHSAAPLTHLGTRLATRAVPAVAAKGTRIGGLKAVPQVGVAISGIVAAR